LVASQKKYETHKEIQDAIERDALREKNKKLIESLGLLYVDKLIIPSSMKEDLSSNISFPQDPEHTVYYKDMLDRHYIAPMKMKRLDLHNYIVSSYEDLLQGDFIGEYTGFLTPKPVNLALSSENSIICQKSNKDQAFIVDADRCCNELGFIRRVKNESITNCRRIHVLGNDGFAHVVYIAAHYIHAGSQLIVQGSDEEFAYRKQLNQQKQLELEPLKELSTQATNLPKSRTSARNLKNLI
jgi:hypothetical protein